MANVLVVDDVSIMRFTIKKHLTSLGHKVIAEASNGFEAINQYETHNPDIVTMDITMPAENGIKNGIEALVGIKKIDRDAKVIMVTSHGEERLVMEAITKGAKGYILKPITEEKLSDALKQFS